MLNCEQTKGQTVFQHGMSVQQMTLELLGHLSDGLSISGWRIPDWLTANRSEIASNLHSIEDIGCYTLYHDCGKPLCRIVDAEGKVHFPDHAAVSRRAYLEATGDERVANLIGWDMCLHTCTADQLTELLKTWTKQDAYTLLVVALAEVHSNARMFGGVESTSFKIKWKQLDKRGKQILKHYQEKHD